MNRLFYLSSLLFILSLFSCAQSGWKKYDFSAYDFNIEFYQKPELSIDSAMFNGAALATFLWELNVADTTHPNTYYSLSLVNYPSESIHSDSLINVVEGFINSTQYVLFEDSTYALLSSALTEKNGFPGKVFKWKEKESGVFFEFHVFLVENKLFQLSVISRFNENHNIYITKFIDSFEIVNIPDGKFELPKLTNKRKISIKFPQKPKEEQKTIDSEWGQLLLDIRLLEQKTKSDNMVYLAMETKFPTKVVDQSNTNELNEFYEKAIDRSVYNVNGELISIHDIYYKGKPGKEYRCYFSDREVLMVYRLFYDNESLYTYGVVTVPDKDKNREMNKFLDSFEIEK